MVHVHSITISVSVPLKSLRRPSLEGSGGKRLKNVKEDCDENGNLKLLNQVNHCTYHTDNQDLLLEAFQGQIAQYDTYIHFRSSVLVHFSRPLI